MGRVDAGLVGQVGGDGAPARSVAAATGDECSNGFAGWKFRLNEVVLCGCHAGYVARQHEMLQGDTRGSDWIFTACGVTKCCNWFSVSPTISA